MNIQRLLEEEEARKLKGLSEAEAKARKAQWLDLERQAMEAFTARPLPDVAALRKLHNNESLRPGFLPMIERMLAHPDCARH